MKGKTGKLTNKNTPPKVVKKPTGKVGGKQAPPKNAMPKAKKGGSAGKMMKGKMC